MDVSVRITRETPAVDPSVTVTASGATVREVFDLMLAATELVIGREIAAALEQNGATAEQVAFATPLRTRLHLVEQLMDQPFRSFEMVVLDL